MPCPPSERTRERPVHVEIAAAPSWLPEDEYLAGDDYLRALRRGR
jgi:hypothetical protein